MYMQMERSLSNVYRKVDNRKIFKNRVSLLSKFIPNELPHREQEMRELSYHLSYAADGENLGDLLLLGRPGVGKTAVTLNVLNEFSQRTTDAKVVYTVASGTPYRVLANLIDAVGGNVPSRGVSFEEAWKRFKKLTNGLTIVVLDELDKMLIHGSELLYSLSRDMNFATIAISNRYTVLDMIKDGRVASSFNPFKIVFQEYSREQLEDILEFRAELAFYDDAYDDDVISACAAYATQRGGDMRYGLDLLKYAGDICVKSGDEKVRTEHVEKARDIIEEDFIRKGVSGLGYAQKLLLLCVLYFPGRQTSLIYTVCNIFLQAFYHKKLTSRRLSTFLRDLDLQGFVTINIKGRGRGKGLSSTAIPSDSIDKNLVGRTIISSLAEDLEIDRKELLSKINRIVDGVKRKIVAN